MTDAQLALLVLVLLYLWECLLWLRREAACLIPRITSGAQIRIGGGMYGTDGKAVLLAHPIPWLSQAFVCQQWPVSLSPEGCFSYVSQAFNPGARPAQMERFFDWDNLARIEFTDDRVDINGRPFIRVATPHLARHLAGVLRRLKDAPATRREALIASAIHDFLDAKAVAENFARYRRVTRSVRWLCDGMFAYAFVICPIVIYQVGLAGTWDLLLGLLVLFMISIALTWRHAHRVLYPREGSDRLKHLVPIATFPPATIRAGSFLSQALLSAHHPLAVARVLCTDAELADLAAQVLRDLDTPIEPVCPDCPPPAERTHAFFRTQLRAAVEEQLVSWGMRLDRLRAAPCPDDDSSRAYCPRCHTQFLMNEGTCNECGGLVLQALSGPSVDHLPLRTAQR